MDFSSADYLIVGAGLFGSVMAERIAADMGRKVIVIDKRDHLGGNCHSAPDPDTGIECHLYGTHIFHTSDSTIWEYISRFTKLNTYRHRVLASLGGRSYHMPVNLLTVNDFYGISLKPWELDTFLAREAARDAFLTPKNLEERAISRIGRPLYNAFIKGYTQKQWNTDPRRLPASIVDRLPIRTTCKTDYFDDCWQGVPVNGYGAMFRRMLRHPLIHTELGIHFEDIRSSIPARCTVIYTGPIDTYFGYRFGRLGWRSLEFVPELHLVPDFQGAAVVNYPESHIPWTRIHEFKHLHEERPAPKDATLICKEYPRDVSIDHPEPYYPMRLSPDMERFDLYKQAALNERNVIFGGRLGSYAYLDMDTTIRQALDTYALLREGADAVSSIPLPPDRAPSHSRHQ